MSDDEADEYAELVNMGLVEADVAHGVLVFSVKVIYGEAA